MSTHHDKVFFVSFLSVLGFLVVFTIAIVFAARTLTGDKELTPQQLAKIEERIRPAGQVNTDANATVPSAAGEPVAKVALTGEQVVAQVCSGCHTGVIPNAPKIGDKSAWSARGGLGQLVASAIKGKNAMPARGGKPDLSDGEIEAAIKHMSGL